MSRIQWKEQLHWTNEHLEELRQAGFAYIRQGKYDMALPFFEALVVLDLDSAYDFQTLGALYIQLNEPKKALKILDRALQLDGEHGPTLLNVAKALVMVGKKAEGLKLAHVLQKDSNSAVASIAKALILAYS